MKNYLIILAASLVLAACGARVEHKKGQTAPPGEGEQPPPTEEPPIAPGPPAKTPPPPGKEKIARDSSVMQSRPGQHQFVRKDHGQVLLLNGAGDIVVAGVTRSKIERAMPVEPSFAGDLFLTRYSQKHHKWSNKPIQVAVEAPPPPTPEPTPENPNPEPEEPKPLPEPLLVAKGGRLFDSGQAMVVGELIDTKFSDRQLFVEETDTANRTVFLAIFGRDDNGLVRSVRYGLTGDNTVIGAAGTRDQQSLLISGQTETGLLTNASSGEATEVPSRANYLATVDVEGNITRHHAWSIQKDAEAPVERVAKLAATDDTALLAIEKGDGKAVTLRSFRIPKFNNIFIELPELPVCEAASQGAQQVRAATVDVQIVDEETGEGEVLVAVEISNDSVSPGTVLPCFEVFKLNKHGTLIAKREVAFLAEQPTVAGTVKAHLVADNRIFVARSRETTDSRGTGEIVVTHLYERPTMPAGYVAWKWDLNRPDWYEGDSVNGLHRRLGASTHVATADQGKVVWMLANDITQKEEHTESLVHIGAYRAIPEPAPETEETPAGDDAPPAESEATP